MTFEYLMSINRGFEAEEVTAPEFDQMEDEIYTEILGATNDTDLETAYHDLYALREALGRIARHE